MTKYYSTPVLNKTPGLYYAWAKLIRVKDGDTAVIRRNLGHGVFFDCTIRLEGYDAPELFRPKSPEEKIRAIAAKYKLKTLLTAYHPFLTQTLYTERVPRGLKSFDRWRSHVWIERLGELVSVSEIMLKCGY